MKFAVAGPEHEARLRALIGNAEMPGWVRLSYEHEPNLFRSVRAGFREAQVIVALEGDEVVGCGYRCWWRAMVNGEPQPVGYIGGLRSLARVRGGMGLARGYRFLRQLHDDGQAPAYLTTILEDNRQTIELLTSGRSGLPTYRPLGRFQTRAVLTNRRRRPRVNSLELHSATELGWDRVVEFLGEAGRRRNFGPCAGGHELGALTDLGLQTDRFLFASSSGRLRACAALWDVSSFRQKVVRGYGATMSTLRPLLNLVLRGLGFTQLPPAGDSLKLPFAAIVASVDDDPRPLAAIFDRFHQLCVADGSSGFVAGFHADDPLAGALEGFRTLTYGSLVFLVHWEDGRGFADDLDVRLVPYLETALL